MKSWLDVCEKKKLGDAFTTSDGEELCRQGDEVDAVYLIHGGSIELLTMNERGVSQVAQLLIAPAIVGAAEVLGGAREWRHTLRCVGPVRGIVLGRHDFLPQLREDASLHYECLLTLALQQCDTRFCGDAPSGAVDQRLARLLLAYANAVGIAVIDGVCLPIARTDADLSAAVGASDRQARRVFNVWRKKHWLCRRNHQIILRDQSALKRQLTGEKTRARAK